VGEGSSILFLADVLPVSCSHMYRFLFLLYALFMANARLKPLFAGLFTAAVHVLWQMLSSRTDHLFGAVGSTSTGLCAGQCLRLLWSGWVTAGASST